MISNDLQKQELIPHVHTFNLMCTEGIRVDAEGFIRKTEFQNIARLNLALN
jgi:hypothetical protein